MHITTRSYLTAGIAALGAGAMALTPVQPIPNPTALAQERAVGNLAVTLASTIDPITHANTTMSSNPQFAARDRNETKPLTMPAPARPIPPEPSIHRQR